MKEMRKNSIVNNEIVSPLIVLFSVRNFEKKKCETFFSLSSIRLSAYEVFASIGKRRWKSINN